jgi:hypothetical protein
MKNGDYITILAPMVSKLKLNGSLLIDNLQFISWLENRAKVDIDQEIWNKMKQNINYYL